MQPICTILINFGKNKKKMSKTKEAYIRYRIIDECFQNTGHLPSTAQNSFFGGCWTIEELIDKIFEKTDGKLEVSDRTIQYDFEHMKIEFGAPIENERGIGYRYSDPSFSLTKNPLTENDFKMFDEVIEILKNYSSFKYFEDSDTLISKRNDQKSDSQYSKIQLDTLPAYKGFKNISVIKDAIFERNPICISNKEFEKEETDIIFHPYILKEFNNRWFVLGYADKKKGKYGKLWLLALDRIVKIQPSEIKYKKPNKKELRNYFSDIFGVTNYSDKQKEKVIAKIEKFRSNYFKTKPIHKSQKLIKEEADFDYYSLKLKLNNEIISLFLSFGKDLEVIEPESFRQEIKLHVQQMNLLYS
jgi:predicted DNA-binding transcriptional regulator YafY